jgi:hypothetical protein
MANTIDFNVSTNAVTVLNQTGAAAETTAKGFTSAKQELRALQNQMLEMDQTSDAFKKASARAAELKDNIGDLSAEINANAGNAFEGLSNNVSLFGSRLMNLDLKGAGQALTGMGSAVKNIDFKTIKTEVGGLATGLKNLGSAVLQNPFFIAGAALIATVVYWKEIKAAVDGTAQKVKKLEESNIVLEKQNVILDARINKEKTLYGESFKTLELEKEKAINNISVAENELAIARTTGDINTIREKENKLIETRNFLSNITNKGEADRMKLVEDAKNLTIAGYKEEQERKNAAAKFEAARQQQLAVIAEKQRLAKANLQTEELTLTEKQYKTERANFVEKDIETKKVLIVSERQKQLQSELTQLLEEEKILREATVAVATSTTVQDLKKQEVKINKENNKEVSKGIDILEQNAIAAAKELKIEQEIAAEKLKLEQDLIRAKKDERGKELYDLQLKKELELQTYEGDEEDKLLIIEKYRFAELDINKKYDDAAFQLQLANDEKKKAADEKAKEDELEREKQLAADKLAAEQALMDAKFNLASASVNLLGTLFAKNKKAADIAFALDKALAIAQVVVNTQREISAYNANPVWSLSPDGGASIKIPAIIGAKIRAAASIAAIAGTAIGRFAGGGGGGSNNAGSNGGNGGEGTTAPSPANFAFLQNQPNQQPPLQAYVVGSQVSSNLEAQQLIQNQSRLGG